MKFKKGQQQITGLIVFIVLSIVSLALIGMFESESHFVSNTITSFTSTSNNPMANVLVKLIVPIMIIIGLIIIFLTIRSFLNG